MMRAIRQADTVEVGTKIAKAIGLEKHRLAFRWDEDDLKAIGAVEDYGLGGIRPLFAPEIVALAAAGIHPGANGWEVEDDGDLGDPCATCPHRRGLHMIADDSCSQCDCAGFIERAAPDLGAKINRRPLPNPWKWIDRDGNGTHFCLSRGFGLGMIAGVIAGPPTTWEIGLFTGGGERFQLPTVDAAKAAAEAECWERGLFLVGLPDLGAKVDALHEAASAEPSPAARALFRLLLTATGLGELHPPTLADRINSTHRLCESFVSELRATLFSQAAPPAPRSPDATSTPVTTDGALAAYLLEHYRDAWRPGDDALALAIRLLETQARDIANLSATLNTAIAEAETSDANAAELSGLLTAARGSLAVEESLHRLTSEECLSVKIALASLRNGIANLVTKNGGARG